MGRNSEQIVPTARRVTAAPGPPHGGENMAARLPCKVLAPAGRFGQQDARFRGALPVDVQEIKKLDNYLKRLFGNPRIRVVPRPKKDDSAEVYIGEEFIGVLFLDDEDQDRSYNFQMAILETDLE
jgi:Protein of unknown function (DUF3126)